MWGWCVGVGRGEWGWHRAHLVHSNMLTDLDAVRVGRDH